MVDGWPTPLKIMSSSIGMIIFNIWKIKMFQTTNQWKYGSIRWWESQLHFRNFVGLRSLSLYGDVAFVLRQLDFLGMTWLTLVKLHSQTMFGGLSKNSTEKTSSRHPWPKMFDHFRVERSVVTTGVPSNNVLLVKIGWGRWLVYNLSSFTCYI